MESNYNKIDIADIWKYERSLFLNGRSNIEIARKIIDNVEDIIRDNGIAVYDLKDCDNGDEKFQKYYSIQLENYINALRNLESRFSLGYFFTSDSCFHYDDTIILDNTYNDFDFWFALKLRQYDSSISKIDDYLDFQMETSFNNDKVEYFEFLKLVIKQYQGSLIGRRIIRVVYDWIEKRKHKKRLSNKGHQKKKGENKSLSHKMIEKVPNYLKKGEGRVILLEIFKDLQNAMFINKKTSFDNFISIFSNVEISKENKIVWIGTNVELQWFMKYLVYESNKVDDLKNDIWLVAVKCFVDKLKNEFDKDQLRNASGKNLERKKRLESILSKL